MMKSAQIKERKPKMVPTIGGSVYVRSEEMEWRPTQFDKVSIKILYEDKHRLVINKQAGLVTHPGAGHQDDTLANALLHHCGSSLQAIHGTLRPGIVHRLDKDTTGCLVAAKSEAAFVGLQAMIAAHEVTRIYLALVWGDLREDSGTIDAALGRGGDRKKMTLRAPGGKPAVTRFQVRAS